MALYTPLSKRHLPSRGQGVFLRRISTATVRAIFTLLLERIAQVGEGARRAESRRGLERMEEERMRLDREAQWLARVRGVGLVNRGRFFA